MGETLQHLGIDWSKLIAQTVNFGIILFILWKWVYGPVLKLLQERRDKIAESMANADKIKIELAKAEASRQEILSQANVSANKMIEEARIQAQKVLETETQKAIATANQIIVKARESNDAELARMKTELRREMVHLVAETTAKVTGKILTTEDQQRLAEETNKQLAA